MSSSCLWVMTSRLTSPGADRSGLPEFKLHFPILCPNTVNWHQRHINPMYHHLFGSSTSVTSSHEGQGSNLGRSHVFPAHVTDIMFVLRWTSRVTRQFHLCLRCLINMAVMTTSALLPMIKHNSRSVVDRKTVWCKDETSLWICYRSPLTFGPLSVHLHWHFLKVQLLE